MFFCEGRDSKKMLSKFQVPPSPGKIWTTKLPLYHKDQEKTKKEDKLRLYTREITQRYNSHRWRRDEKKQDEDDNYGQKTM